MTLLSAVIHFFEPISKYGWAAVVLAAIGLACVMLFVGSIGLIGWRLFRPIAPTQGPNALDKATLAGQNIGQLDLDEFVNTRLRAEFVTQAQSHTYDERLDRVEKVARDFKDQINGIEIAVRSKLAEIEDKNSDFSKEYRSLNYKWDEWTRQHCDNQDTRFKWVDMGFAAIQNREWHRKAFEQLRAEFAEISEPVNEGIGIVNSHEWISSLKYWRSNLDQWLSLVEYYTPGVTERILGISDVIYDGVWSFNEDAMTPNQVHRFKEVSIFWSNALSEKGYIDQCLDGAAFYSPSTKGRPDSPPRPPECI